MTKITGNIVLNDRVIAGEIEYEKGFIRRIKECSIPKNAPYIFAGFIDIHTHGTNGFDVMSESVQDIANMAIAKAQQGVTHFLPTTLTAPKAQLLNVLDAIRRCHLEQQAQIQGASILGIHFEGPYISSGSYRGAQNPLYTCDPSMEEFQQYFTASGGLIKLITLAPERIHALDFIKQLTAMDIRPSLGHSEASSSIVKEAIAAGLISGTHLFNGMKEFNHYDLGCAGTLLLNDDVYCEMIGDMHHVVADAMELVFRCKPLDKILIITDSIFCSGLEDGVYQLGGTDINLKNDEARTVNVGGLAGSVATMDKILYNLVMSFGSDQQRRPQLTLPQISQLLSGNQAKFLGLDKHKIGQIKVGNQANFALFDQHFHWQSTIGEGQVIGER